jgi:hypothetical protein
MAWTASSHKGDWAKRKCSCDGKAHKLRISWAARVWQKSEVESCKWELNFCQSRAVGQSFGRGA